MSIELDIFQRMCFTRYFELRVLNAYDNGLIKVPVYLSIGQESISASIASVISDCYIFAQHRAHSVYLAFGGDPGKLIDELLGRPNGCSGGMGGSASIQDPKIKMVGHHGLIGENVPMAVGAALGAPGEKVVCFFGDGAAEEDYVFGAMGFAVTHKLPVLFVCEDNDLSILTPKNLRRSWSITDVATSIGMPSFDISDDPMRIIGCAKQAVENLPAFINCRTCRHHWHVGTGVDAPPSWDRLALFGKDIATTNEILARVGELAVETKRDVDGLWNEHLQIQ